jgi:hypothetical protein
MATNKTKPAGEFSRLGKALTGLSMPPAPGLRAGGCLTNCNADHLERRWIMNSRFRKLGVESLEGRSVLSTMVEADFNGDGHLDMAAITAANTIEVSLFDPADGGYDVSDILAAPKNWQFVDIYAVWDGNADGDLEITALATKPSGWSYVNFSNNGDGTFDYIEPAPGRGPNPRWWRGF